MSTESRIPEIIDGVTVGKIVDNYVFEPISIFKKLPQTHNWFFFIGKEESPFSIGVSYEFNPKDHDFEFIKKHFTHWLEMKLKVGLFI